MALSQKQQSFIDNYSGNATEAAKLAGYSEATAYSQGQRLLKQPQIAEAIRTREHNLKQEQTDRREIIVKWQN